MGEADALPPLEIDTPSSLPAEERRPAPEGTTAPEECTRERTLYSYFSARVRAFELFARTPDPRPGRGEEEGTRSHLSCRAGLSIAGRSVPF